MKSRLDRALIIDSQEAKDIYELLVSTELYSSFQNILLLGAIGPDWLLKIFSLIKDAGGNIIKIKNADEEMYAVGRELLAEISSRWGELPNKRHDDYTDTVCPGK
jgi:hypothetical protein